MDKKKWLVFIDDLERAVEDPARVFTDDKKDFDKNNKNNAPFERAKRDMGTTHPAATPDAVVQITSTTEAQNIVNLCRRRRVPVVPRGAGTGLEGGCVAYSGGVVIDTGLMKSMSLDRTQRTATVGAGALKNELNAFLEPHGFIFGPDPSSNPSIGGMASTGGSGLSTLKYGTSKENIVSMKVVTPKGDVIETRRNVRKNSTGYDLNALYLGAEGTLGVITELTVKLFPIPKTRVGAVVQFETVKDAAETVVLARNANLETLLRCEMLNAEGVQVSNVVFKTKMIETPTLFLEFVDSKRPEEGGYERAKADYDRFIELAKLKNCRESSIQFAENAEALDSIWEARRGCYLGAMRYRGIELGTHKKEKVYVGDVCVPISNLADSITNAERLFKRAKFPCVMCCHIADGNYHCLIPFNDDNEKELHQLEDKLVKAALNVGGVASGEHGVGVGKMKHIVREHGEAHVDVQRSIKKALDPLNIMNPGKVISWTTETTTTETPQYYSSSRSKL
jgi:D-lactate dehydrogenase (cytochrome)